jgi:hypothetical protein
MATFHAVMTQHSADCDNYARHDECEDGRTVDHLFVAVEFHPEPGATVRDCIRLARTAAMFAAREQVEAAK